MGTWTAIERPDSRIYSFSDRWGDQVLERSWHLGWEPATGAQPDPYPGDGDIRANLPVRPQERLEAAVHSPSTQTADAILKRYVCRSVTVEALRERPYTWMVRARYTTDQFPWQATDDWGVEYVKQTRTVGSRAFQLYRRGTFAVGFNGGTQAWPATADIGGTKVDINGNPQQYHVAQQALIIETRRDRTASSTTADDPNWATVLTTYINKRNNASFLGWATGSVLCTGITASLDDEVWRISATFLFDDWYHLVQVPVAMPTGQPLLLPGATIAGNQQRQVDKVVWFQPYPDTANLSGLYGSTVTEQFTKAGPIRIP